MKRYDRLKTTDTIERALVGDLNAMREVIELHAPLLLAREADLSTALLKIEELCSQPALTAGQARTQIWGIATEVLSDYRS